MSKRKQWIKQVEIVNEPATMHLSTLLLPFGDDLTILREGDQPVGLVIDRRLQEVLFQKMKFWRRPFLPHRLNGNTCHSCGRIIDDRAKSCPACRRNPEGYGSDDES